MADIFPVLMNHNRMCNVLELNLLAVRRSPNVFDREQGLSPLSAHGRRSDNIFTPAAGEDPTLRQLLGGGPSRPSPNIRGYGTGPNNLMGTARPSSNPPSKTNYTWFGACVDLQAPMLGWDPFLLFKALFAAGENDYLLADCEVTQWNKYHCFFGLPWISTGLQCRALATTEHVLVCVQGNSLVGLGSAAWQAFEHVRD